MSIPLAKPWVGPDEMAAVERVISSGWLGLGPTVKRFEDAVAETVGARHCVAVSSGTAAIHLALEVIGVRGGEVIVPSFTFAATVQAILAAGGIPVFADCREDDLNLDASDVANRITPRTRAIVPVHYAGTPVDLSSLLTLARQYTVHVVEDAAHAFGSVYGDVRIGGTGHMTCFSFDPIKTITCCEGGAVCTNDAAWAEGIRRKRSLGSTRSGWERRGKDRKYEITEPGYRYHMNDVNAAVGLAQLNKMPATVRARREIAARYDARLEGAPGLALLRHDLEKDVPFCYTVKRLGGDRDSLMLDLAGSGVETDVLYPPNHRQPAFSRFAHRLPVTERVAQEIVSLPLFPEMTKAQVDYVADRVLAYCHRSHMPA